MKKLITLTVLFIFLAVFSNTLTVSAEELVDTTKTTNNTELSTAEFSRYITFYDYHNQEFVTQLELFGDDGNFYVFNLEDSTPREEDVYSIYKIDYADNQLSYRQYFEHTVIVYDQTEDGSLCTDDNNLIWWVNQSYPVGVEIVCTVEKISNAEYEIINAVSNYNY